MPRRAVIDKETLLTNADGQPLLDAHGKRIRKVIWHWEPIPDPDPEDPGVLGYDPAVLEEMLRKSQEPPAPKRYRLTFTYADGETRSVEGGPDEAMGNDAIGRSLHTADLVGCSTEVLKT